MNENSKLDKLCVAVKRQVVVLFVVVVAVLAASIPAAAGVGVSPPTASVEGSPSLSVIATENRVTPGETTTLGVTVMNQGDIEKSSNPSLNPAVTTARGVRLEVRSGSAPITVHSGKIALGDVPTGTIRPSQIPELNVRISVDEDAKPGTYRLPVDVRYTYTEKIINGTYEDRTLERTKTLELRIVEDARFEVVRTTSDAPIGGSGTVSITLRSTGDERAHDASVTVESLNPELTFGGSPTATTYVGKWASGETRTLTFPGTVAPTAQFRLFALQTTVNYENSDGVPGVDMVTTGVSPAGSGFGVVLVDTTAPVGDSGQVDVHITNTGSLTLRDTAVTFQSPNAAFTFEGSPTAKTYVGDWEPGETKNLVVEAAFAPTAEKRSYAVDATVAYTSPGGATVTSSTLTFGVTPAAEQSFSIERTDSSLRVDEEGQLSGRLVNEGPAKVKDAVLVLQQSGSNIDIVETEYAVGTLAPGEAANFSYYLEVSSEAHAEPHQFTYRVRYENQDGDTVVSDPLNVRVRIQEKRQVLDIVPINASVERGKTATITVELTNTGDQTLSDISAKLFTDDPLSATDDEAFIGELGPGESAQIVFQVSVGDQALLKTYRASVDFRYDEPDGDTKITDTYRVPIDVEERQDGGVLGGLLAIPPTVNTLALLGLVGAGLLAIGFAVRRRGLNVLRRSQ